MRVSFRRFPGHSSAYSVIERDDGVVYRMKEFTRAGTRLPHDLRHFVVERELGIADGIWGGIAAGMVYTSMDHVQGRRPPHSAERSDELQRARRQQLMRAELLANLVEAIAMVDAPSGDDIRGSRARRCPRCPSPSQARTRPMSPPCPRLSSAGRREHCNWRRRAGPGPRGEKLVASAPAARPQSIPAGRVAATGAASDVSVH
jgi:hypothetical protein